MQKDIRSILEKVQSGHYDEQDEAIAKFWLFRLKNEDLEQISESELEATSTKMWNQLYAEKAESMAKSRLWIRIASVAAAIVIVGFISYFIYQNDLLIKPTNTTSHLEDVLPGSNMAYLTTEDGKTVSLSSAKSGLVIGSDISYEDGSKVDGLGKLQGAAQIVTMTVPKGGVYQVQLADGTKVWLNSDSKLTYPTRFTDSSRIVTLEGEAYFDVQSNYVERLGKKKKISFVVKTKEQSIEVLGTRFNVSAFSNQSNITTLVEGEVNISAYGQLRKLVPSEQAVLSGKKILVTKVDVEPFISWKEGVYVIRNQTLLEFFSQIERWYNVKVDLGQVGARKVSLIIRRDIKLSELLYAIELHTGIKFKIEGRRVVVTDSNN